MINNASYTKFAFRSFKKGSEEENLIQVEQFLKIISSKVLQISVFLLYRPSYQVIYFSHLEVQTIITQIHNRVNISHGKLCDMHGTLKPFDD